MSKLFHRYLYARVGDLLLSWSVPVALGLVLLAGPAVAQNGYSFINARAAAANYSIATVTPGMSCAEMLRLDEPGLTVTSAVVVLASDAAPAHCRVRGVITPEVQFELLLPEQWNRRLYMHGNGGFGGQGFDQPAGLAFSQAALRHGFAALTTNTGHDGANEPGASFAYHNFQKRVDYAYRAVHVTALAGRRLSAAYYRRAPAFSYFDGCSGGGRQALMSAQRYPEDFDGIVAGAPLLNFSGSAVGYLWTASTLRETMIPSVKLPLIAEAVFRKCDRLDGTADGLLQDPRQCSFDPDRELTRCTDSRSSRCFTEAELTALKRIYGGSRSQGKPYFFGQLPGGEAPGVSYLVPHDVRTGWFEWVEDPRGPAFQATQLGEQFIKYLAFPSQDPEAGLATFDFDRDPARMTAGRELIDATNPDLSGFRKHGGKLLMYFGWADTAINPLSGIEYYEKAAAASGPKTDDFFRLFMMPGVFHCYGGYGPDRLDAMTSLIDWVERGNAPDAILATRTEWHDGGRVVRERPLCPYPRIAKFTGQGSIDAASSFRCENP